MTKQTSGIRHITALVGHRRENVDFYAGVLGLPEKTMGEKLMLPKQFEQYREQLERRLIPIKVRELDK